MGRPINLGAPINSPYDGLILLFLLMVSMLTFPQIKWVVRRMDIYKELFGRTKKTHCEYRGPLNC